jgi:hypothetical protein
MNKGVRAVQPDHYNIPTDEEGKIRLSQAGIHILKKKLQPITFLYTLAISEFSDLTHKNVLISSTPKLSNIITSGLP